MGGGLKNRFFECVVLEPKMLTMDIEVNLEPHEVEDQHREDSSSIEAGSRRILRTKPVNAFLHVARMSKCYHSDLVLVDMAIGILHVEQCSERYRFSLDSHGQELRSRESVTNNFLTKDRTKFDYVRFLE